MARERQRPPLSGEVVSTGDILDKNGKVIATGVEIHTFDSVPFEPDEALKNSVSSGDVETGNAVKEFLVKEGKGKTARIVKSFRQGFTKLFAKSESGAIAMAGGDESEVWKLFSDAFNSNDETNIYVDLRNAAQGPDKAIERVARIILSLPENLRAEAAEKLGLDLDTLSKFSNQDEDEEDSE